MLSFGIFLAMIPPLLYAVINHIDNQLLDKYFKEGGVGTLLLFSTLFSFFAIPYAFVMDNTVLDVSQQSILIMLVVGILNVILLYYYLKAMQIDDPTVVVLYYQLVPPIALVLGFIILDETITAAQLLAMLIILAGTTLASIEYKPDETLRFRWRTLVYMGIATLCWASETTIGKIVVLNESVYASIFWESTAMVFLGVLLFIFVSDFRQRFITAFRVNSKGILGLSITGEAVYAAGNAFATHAVFYAPVALVLVMQPLQTIFVFFIGIILTHYLPKIYHEKLTGVEVLQKTTAILISGIGTYMLLNS
jgi:drug/metabolite transporter (DMT)-like permease